MTARQIGVAPVLMASANAAGGVMGKMIAAPSVVVASTAAQTYGQEGSILRFVFLHGLALAALAGICVSLLATSPSWPASSRTDPRSNPSAPSHHRNPFRPHTSEALSTPAAPKVPSVIFFLAHTLSTVLRWVFVIIEIVSYVKR